MTLDIEGARARIKWLRVHSNEESTAWTLCDDLEAALAECERLGESRARYMMEKAASEARAARLATEVESLNQRLAVEMARAMDADERAERLASVVEAARPMTRHADCYGGPGCPICYALAALHDGDLR